MTSVWIVESGDYSDYSVDAIFFTEAQAQEFATASGGSFREWPLDTWTLEQVKVAVIFDKAGNVLRIDDLAYTESAPACDGIECSSAYEGNLAIKVRRGPRERAIKVASEKRIQLMEKLDEAKQRCGRLEAQHAEHAMALREELRRMERWYYGSLALAGMAVLVIAGVAVMR
jgi:hypothetical protein